MPKGILDALQIIGAVASPIAALIVSLDLGRRSIGFAMVIFVVSSVALIIWGFLSEEAHPIAWQNVVLLAINAIGVWRYLIAPSNRKARQGTGRG
ncbi:MAG: hypothetical protein ABI673_00625 [Novosphingobium sp.]